MQRGIDSIKYFEHTEEFSHIHPQAECSDTQDPKLGLVRPTHDTVHFSQCADEAWRATEHAQQPRPSARARVGAQTAEALEAELDKERSSGAHVTAELQKALADAQHKNGHHGGMLWFEVKGGTSAGRKLMDSVQRPWSLCENLGAVESIITCPSVMLWWKSFSQSWMQFLHLFCISQ